MKHKVASAATLPAAEHASAACISSGIRALMLAILDDAMHSLSSPKSLVRAAAEHWMASPERRYVFSFVVICETLELEPSAVRRSVMTLLGKKRTRGRLLRRTRPNVRHSGPLRITTGHHD